MSSEHNKQSYDASDYHATEELESFENDLPNYNRYIVGKFLHDFQNLFPDKISDKRVLDFGAGIGTLALIWNENFPDTKPICLEIDNKQRDVISTKGFRAIASLNELDQKLDFIYTSNVLEHIEDDSESLTELSESLQPEGALIIYVPAFQILFSDLDRKAGHYRRYKKKDLVRKLMLAGFEIKDIQYVDCIGFFAGITLRILGWKKFGNIGDSKSLRFYDKSIFPISRTLDFLGFKYLFGKNLYVVAQKKSPVSV